MGPPAPLRRRSYRRYRHRRYRPGRRTCRGGGRPGGEVRDTEADAARASLLLRLQPGDPRASVVAGIGDRSILADARGSYRQAKQAARVAATIGRAGDTKASAERLSLHRGTLYYRLQKAEQIAGVDLRSGCDRLALHLGFKLARLIGLYPKQIRGTAAGR